jgi:hypothetical protein
MSGAVSSPMQGLRAGSQEASLLPPFVSPRAYARWATGTLVAALAMAWVAVGVELAQLRLMLVASSGQRITLDARLAQDYTNGVLMAVQLVLLVAAGIAFVLWLFQARVNLRALGVRRPSYPRHWAWAGFLVPPFTFFRPFQVAREVWKASDPANLDPFNWRVIRTPRLLWLWWVSFVGWGVLELLAQLMTVGAGLNLKKLELATSISVGADALAAVAACLACFVVSRLSDLQEAKWARLREAEASAPA